MSLLEAVALLCSVAGIYILTGRPFGDRQVRVGSVSIPVTGYLGGILTGTGLLALAVFGVWPAEWWSWKESLLSPTWKGQEPPGLFDLPKQSPEFWFGAVVAVSAAVLVVVGSARILRVSFIVFALGGALLLWIASDIVGFVALAAVALGSAVPMSRKRTDDVRADSVPVAENEIAASPEPFLATVICVLLAWGLIRGIHIASTFEAGPGLAGMGTSPALPRAALDEVGAMGTASQEIPDDDQDEGWLLGLTIAILIAGAAAARSTRQSDRPSIAETSPSMSTGEAEPTETAGYNKPVSENK
ncbi:MAG: hypothetical protein H8E37_07405 [Planctomycetes bacterium]|nr:hypothetical protein [Planctomycetota bacterium]